MTATGVVAFSSEREGLVLNDTNKDYDIFVSSPVFVDIIEPPPHIDSDFSPAILYLLMNN